MASSKKKKEFVHYTREIGNKKRIKQNIGKAGLIALVSVCVLFVAVIFVGGILLIAPWGSKQDITETAIGNTGIPAYSGKLYIELNGNEPSFTEQEIRTIYGEHYSNLDVLGRCGVAYGRINHEMMPTDDRSEIGMIKPTGWHTVKYPGVIEDLYLYNRCHLIAYCLTGQNANELNLITGTRYFNEEGMLPFELIVAKYLDYSDNNVLYRVTPIYEGNDLVAQGVEMEAYSVEDNGAGVCFHVFVYNVQPGIIIDYSTGESWEE